MSKVSLDTMDISEIRKMINSEIGDEPDNTQTDIHEENLDDILAEMHESPKQDSNKEIFQKPEFQHTQFDRDEFKTPQRTQQMDNVVPLTNVNVQKTRVEQENTEEQIARQPKREKKKPKKTAKNDTGKLLNQITGQITGKLKPFHGRDEIGNISELDKDEEENTVEEELEQVRNPKVATKTCSRRAKSLNKRSRFVFLILIATVYISFASHFNLPIPASLSYTESLFIFPMALIGLQVIAMLIAIDIVGLGFFNLFTGKPDLLTAVSFSLASTLIHCATIIVFYEWGRSLPFTAISVCLLYITMKAEASKFAGRQRTYKAATLTGRAVGVYAHRSKESKSNVITKFPIEDIKDFLIQVEKKDIYDSYSRIYGSIVIVMSIILAALASLGAGEPTRFFWAFSAIISASIPFGAIAAFGVPYKNVAKVLLKDGAAISGVKLSSAVKKSNQVVVKDGDLFPSGTTEIIGFKVFGNYNVERVLAYAAGVTEGSGSEISKLFAETLYQKYGRPLKANNVLQYESGGMSGEISGDTVLIGTVQFMMRMGIRINEGRNIRNGVFVAINSEIAGIFALQYNPSAQSYGALQALFRNGKYPFLAVRDFNITPNMVEKMFDLKRGCTEYPEVNQRNEVSDPSYVENDTVCGILSRDGIAPFSICILGASKLSTAVKFNIAISTIAGVCGMLITFYLAYIYAVTSATPHNVFLYLLLWYIPVLLISHNCKKGY